MGAEQTTLTRWLGPLLERAIRGYVHVFGRRTAIADVPWLRGPIGAPGLSGRALYEAHAAELGTQVGASSADAGLLQRFDTLAGAGFDPGAVMPEVADFYERTAAYRLEAWSAWRWPFKPFAAALVALVSRRIDQINLPIGALDTAQGMTSEVITIEGAPYRGWLRTLAGPGTTIYAGFYTVDVPPGLGQPCVKVVFPVPYGSITVLLRPEAQPDGSFKLVSSGRRFGDAGFYRLVRLDAETFKVAYIPAMKESIHVYVDAQGVLRTTHEFRAWRWLMLTLHYKIEAAARPTDVRPAAG